MKAWPEGGDGVVDKFFGIRTHHGTVIAADVDSGAMSSCDPARLSKFLVPVILYRASADASAWFLCTLNEPLRPLKLMPDMGGEAVLHVRGWCSPAVQTVQLLSPLTDCWVCARPHGPVIADSRIAQAWEQFTLEPIEPALATSSFQHLADDIEWLLSARDDFAGLLDRLDQPGFYSALVAVSQTMPRERLLGLATALASSPRAIANMAAAQPSDLFARIGFPSMAAGTLKEPANRRDPAALRIGPEFDALATIGFDARPTTLAHRLTLILREQVRPTRNVCILATARNEGLNILDWVAYHRSIGVEDIFLYTNDNDDASDGMLAALDAGGAIRWRDSIIAPGGNAQQKAYGHALQLSPEILDYKWALVIDLDEFFGFDASLFRGIGEFLDWHAVHDVDAVAINWVTHGSSGQGRWRDEFVAKRFPVGHYPAHVHIKSAIRPRRFMHSRPHHPIALYGANRIYRAATGGPYVPSPQEFSMGQDPSGDKAWISHFYYKSTEEFILKWSRNRGDYPTSAGVTNLVITEHLVHGFMAQFAALEPEWYSILPCATGMQAELQRLKALPGVAQGHAAIVARHTARMPEIERLFTTAPGVIAAGEVGQAFLATLRS